MRIMCTFALARPILLALAGLASSLPSVASADVLATSGVQGGFVVCIGCDDPEFLASLHPNDSYLVQGLDTDATKIQTARTFLIERNLYGKVSAQSFDGSHLPYVDNLVNLVIVHISAFPIASSEIERVLAPRGVVLVKGTTDARSTTLQSVASAELHGWSMLRKRVPPEIDDWTHFLHDASGNAVAADTRVGSPRRIQWWAGPKRTRDHDALASLSALTSSGGRLFYILDEGPTSLIHRPSQWRLIARDAFNGVLLWKRKIPTWTSQLQTFRSGPLQVTRRLVSVGERVYVTLGLDAPVIELDAATGKTLRTYAGSKKTEELIWHNGRLLTVQGDPDILIDEAPRAFGYWELSVNRKPTVAKSIVVYDADSGAVLWKKEDANLATIAPLSLCALGENVFYLDGNDLHCLDLETGNELWKASFPTKGLFLRDYAPTVVAYEDVVLCLSWNKLWTFSISDGKKLWEQKGSIGFASPGDLFAIDGLVWTIPVTQSIWRGSKRDSTGKIVTGIPIPKDNFLGNKGTEIWGMDVHTGEVEKRFVFRDVLPWGHHHRCYRNKATERFLICGRRGLEYIDLAGNNHVNNWWLRGICQYGVMPANGFIYVPPDPCQCFNFIKVNGFNALAAASTLDNTKPAGGAALEKGPAFAAVQTTSRDSRASHAENNSVAAVGGVWQPPIPDASGDWPTYRGNITRSGSTSSSLPAKLKPLWTADLGGRLTAAVAAGGRIFVCAKETQTVYCLNASDGSTCWEFVAGGPLDSPPTLYDGLCVLGCRDGFVYCLQASDGQLVWRFRAGPIDRRIVSENQLEGVWPVSGSVLVEDDVAYFAAGRSSYLDDGIRVYGLNVYSGKSLYETTLTATPHDRGGQSSLTKTPYTGALPDLLVSDGQTINMRQVQFDKHLKQINPATLRTLIVTTGFLEDLWAHRQNWSLGHSGKINSSQRAGRLGTQPQNKAAQLGKLIVFDDRTAYAVKNPYSWLKYSPGIHQTAHDGHVHQKYARYKANYFPIGTQVCSWTNKARALPRGRQSRARKAAAAALSWAVDRPIQPRAMVLAGDQLFLAGWLDQLEIQEKSGLPLDPNDPDPRHSKLWVLSTQDGSTLADYELAAEPVFDGLAVARGRLLIPLKNGTVVCMGGR